MKKKLILAMPIIIAVLFIDRLSKLLISSNMHLYESISVIGNFFRLTYVTNPYAAFSLKIGNYYVMVALTVVAIIFIMFYFVKTTYNPFKITALSMIIGGAFCTLYDRLVYREVIDFLDFGINKWRFATFNISDSSVVIGVSLLIIFTVINEKKNL